MTVSGEDSAGGVVGPRTVAVAVPYSSEYIPRPPNLRLLRKLADLTGGQVLHVADGAETLSDIFQVAQDGHRPPHNVWYLLIFAALLLYFFDIVARKLPPAEEWLGRLGMRTSLVRRVTGGRLARPQSPLAGTVAEGTGAREAAQRPRIGLPESGAVPSGELYVARLRWRTSSIGSRRTLPPQGRGG